MVFIGQVNGHSNGYHTGPIRACIIGAGAAGLCAARHLSNSMSAFEIDCYEQTNCVGGTWDYTDDIGLSPDGLPIHSSMYKYMRTNLPLEIMQFPDYPATIVKESFVYHTEVEDYLKSYAKHFNLHQFIKFRHHVLKINREINEWSVKVKNIEDGSIFTKCYDAMFICNGRYSKPKIPDNNLIKGIDSFSGKLIHSHDYREAKEYIGQNVVVLGAGPSGIDISIELACYAKKVYLVHQLPQMFVDLPETIAQIKGTVESVDGSEIKLSNGQAINEIDTFLLATGYNYDYDFLDNSCQVKVSPAGRVLNCYLHLININHPTMAIWAIPQRILPFPFYQQQVKLFVKSLAGEIELPSMEEMKAESEADLKNRLAAGISEQYAHKMVGEELLWEYDDRLAEVGKMEKIKPIVRRIYDRLHQIRKTKPVHYKSYRLVIYDDENYSFIKPDGVLNGF